jgi:hypothetical protein
MFPGRSYRVNTNDFSALLSKAPRFDAVLTPLIWGFRGENGGIATPFAALPDIARHLRTCMGGNPVQIPP